MVTDADLDQFNPLLRGIFKQVCDEGLLEGIASGERCIDTQIRLMAEREVAHPGFIAGTYRSSPTKILILAAIAVVPQNVAALEEAIGGAMAQGNPAEISRHEPDKSGKADAGDGLPAGPGPLASRCKELVGLAIAAGQADPHSDVLTNEAGNICTHVQAWPVGT